MSLRPLPKLDDTQAMEKLGRASALRSARLDAIHAMRDHFVRLQSLDSDDTAELDGITACVERIRMIASMQGG